MLSSYTIYDDDALQNMKMHILIINIEYYVCIHTQTMFYPPQVHRFTKEIYILIIHNSLRGVKDDMAGFFFIVSIK